jgi:hypothetical protein
LGNLQASGHNELVLLEITSIRIGTGVTDIQNSIIVENFARQRFIVNGSI